MRLLDRDRVVLLGGVHADNHRARQFRRCSFVETGTFTTADGPAMDMVLDLPCHDAGRERQPRGCREPVLVL